jgi:6,7-dimethyl-8-ribityllumazine synthase
MATFIEGSYNIENVRLTVVVSRFNDMLCNELIRGTEEAAKKFLGTTDGLTFVRVPGAYELSAVAKRIAHSGKTDAVICLGVIIRGGTPHFDYVAGEASKGISNVAFSSPVPVIYGVLTTDTIEQAVERAGTKMGNRGFQCVQDAIEMVSLYRKLATEYGEQG